MEKPGKIDPITALQEGIDGLSLAMFEALRGLRDAVAPESGNLGNNNNNFNNQSSNTSTSSTNGRDLEELWQAYCQGDETVVAMVQKFNPHAPNTTTATATANSISHTSAVASSSNAGITSTGSSLRVIQKRSEFGAWHAFMEREKDKELVERLAAAVILKSDQIDDAVGKVPGLNRTRDAQLQYIEELIAANAAASDELERAYTTAVARRDSCRNLVRKHTSEALGIDEEF